MIGAKINSKMVPLHTKLENTDVVEIVTSSNAKGPSRDWLKYVKTSNARNKITCFLKNKGREENIIKGKELFQKAIRKQKISKEEFLKDKYVDKALKKFSFKTLDDAYENIGFGSISALKVVNRILEVYEEENKEKLPSIKDINQKNKRKNEEEFVIVEGIKNCKTQLAKCCMPIPGDEIVGYITNANGVSIHRKNCKNLKNLDMKSRKIEVSWKEKIKINSKVKLVIMANNRENILNDVLKEIGNSNITLSSVVTKEKQNREIDIVVEIMISDTIELQKLIKLLKRIDSVYDIKRIH